MDKTTAAILGAAGILLLGHVHPAQAAPPDRDRSNHVSPGRPATPIETHSPGLTTAKVELTPAAGIRQPTEAAPTVGSPAGGLPEVSPPDRVARVSKKKSKSGDDDDDDDDKKKKSSVSKSKKKEREKETKKKVKQKKQKTKKKRVSPH